MTVKEYVNSKSLNITFTDLNIKGMLLAVETIDDCVMQSYEKPLEESLEDELKEVLTVKGIDILLANIYLLLATSTGNTISVTRGSVTRSESNSFGVYDRQDFREMANDIFAKWGVIEEEPPFLTYRSFEEF